MIRQLIVTEDGSHTLYLPEIEENYHSTHGAIQESNHVFIDAGLKQINKKELNIFEIGFGTGLNALLSVIEGQISEKNITYFGLEKYPLTKEEYSELNYPEKIGADCREIFKTIHEGEYDKTIKISEKFSIKKIKADILNFNFNNLPLFDLIYFDAFAPNKQSDVWDKTIFKKLYEHCNPDAIFVTYCAKGVVRRDLQEVGFKVNRIPGPPGKREMIRAIK